MRRPAIMALHQGTAFLLPAPIKGGRQGAARHRGRVPAGDGWPVRSGTKPGGRAKGQHPPAHPGMCALLAGTLGLALAARPGPASIDATWSGLILLPCAAMIHAILHLWRQTSPRGGALRAVTPHFMPRYL
jgi:hypothetical protein